MATLTRRQADDTRTIHVRQGVSWRGIFTWTQPADPPTDPPTYEPVDTTGWTARFTWLPRPGAAALITITSPDSDDGGIDMTDDGVFTVHLNAAQTATLKQDGAYQLVVVSAADPNEIEPVASGYANLLLAAEPFPFPLEDA